MRSDEQKAEARLGKDVEGRDVEDCIEISKT